MKISEQKQELRKQLEKLQADVLHKTSPATQLDPATILMIATVILEIIKFLQTWYSNKSAAKEMRKVGFITRWRLKAYIKNTFDADKVEDVYEAMLASFRELTTEESSKLFI